MLLSTLDNITGQHPTGEPLADRFYFLVHSFTEHLPSARDCAGLWGYSSELDGYGPTFLEVRV